MAKSKKEATEQSGIGITISITMPDGSSEDFNVGIRSPEGVIMKSKMKPQTVFDTLMGGMVARYGAHYVVTK